MDGGSARLLLVCAVLVVSGCHKKDSDSDPATLFTPSTGVLDVDFGTGGVVTTAVPGMATSVVLQPDGKIVIGVMYGGGGFTVLRFLTDGSPDGSFDGDGIATAAVGSDWTFGVALQSDGKIVAAGGTGWDGDFLVVRFSADGSLDTTFGGTGSVTVDFHGMEDIGHGLAIQPDGKIVVAGFVKTAADNGAFGVIRLKTDGSLDDTFHGDGKATADITATFDQAMAVAIQPDGKIVAVGEAEASASHTTVVRFNANGSLDETFAGGNSFVTTVVGTDSDSPNAMALQPDGKILTTGWFVSATDGVAVVRYKDDGTEDGSFDGDGIVVTTPGGLAKSEARGILVQPDWNIVVSATIYNGVDWDAGVLRYDTNGLLDPTFDGDGIMSVNLGGANDMAGGVVMQPDGKLVVAGSNGTVASGKVCLFRCE